MERGAFQRDVADRSALYSSQILTGWLRVYPRGRSRKGKCYPTSRPYLDGLITPCKLRPGQDQPLFRCLFPLLVNNHGCGLPLLLLVVVFTPFRQASPLPMLTKQQGKQAREKKGNGWDVRASVACRWLCFAVISVYRLRSSPLTHSPLCFSMTLISCGTFEIWMDRKRDKLMTTPYLIVNWRRRVWGMRRQWRREGW